VPHLNATSKKSPAHDEQPLSVWNFGKHEEAPILVNYDWLERAGILANRMDCRRKQLQEGFPPPLQLSANKIAWRWSEVEAWLATRPRRVAGDEPKIGAHKPEAAPAP
jgi:Prophage CP4-57 regulatory protein (AlpA)